ncbi:MAG TPA: nitroreductase/quinone reductase family protein [Candidatus Limnocylindrales bacterium]|jgi:deazaflavin-dependent oxidoreductase (nitroreductase family)
MSAKPPPAWIVRLNTALLRRGFGVGSQQLLTVRGRKSGQPRQTPISIATLAGDRYIVAAFAEANWVLNVQAAQCGTLGRGKDEHQVALTEIAAERRGPILRAFLEQVRGGRRFFGGRTPEEVVAHSADYPVFRVDPVSGA